MIMIDMKHRNDFLCTPAPTWNACLGLFADRTKTILRFIHGIILLTCEAIALKELLVSLFLVVIALMLIGVKASLAQRTCAMFSRIVDIEQLERFVLRAPGAAF